MRTTANLAAVLALLLALAWPAAAPAAGDQVIKSQGQEVYLPAYTRVIYNSQGRTMTLSTTLVVHNTSPTKAIQVVEADFYDGEGKLVDRLIDQPVQLSPFGALDLVIKNLDKAKGIGASFKVTWRAGQKVNAPIIECIGIGAAGQQGISFITRGTVLRELP